MRRPIYGDTDVPLDKLWEGKAVDNLSWQLSLHSLFILRNLVFAHKDTGDIRYLEKGKRIIESWVQHNPRSNPPCRFSWSDHSTALRAVVICAFVDYCNEVGVEDKRFNALVADALLQHGLFLVHPENYTYSQNHGIYQDYALLVTATHLKGAGVSEDWVNVANRRLEKQLAQTYSQNGIHLENSPGYHQSITELLGSIAEYMHAVGLKPSGKLIHTVGLAKARMPMFIMPDGTVVPVGDTFRGDTARITSSRSTDSLIVYPEAGYGVISKAFYIFFMASYNSFDHKHCDDLSVTVSDREGTILGDAGFLNYQENDPRRDFTLSWSAHNTVTVDSQPPLERSLRCGIDAYGKTEKYIFIRGTSLRKAGQVHIRSLMYDIENEVLLIIDSCRSSVPNKWQRLFHFEPGITVELKDNANVMINTPWRKSYAMTIWPSDADLRLVVGREQPLQGWVAQPFGDLIPAPVTVESQTGADITFLAGLGLKDVQNSLQLTSNNRISFKGRAFHRTISILDTSVEVTTTDDKVAARPGHVDVDSIPLQLSKLRDHFEQQRPPIGLKKRMAVVALDAFAWLVVLLIIRTLKTKTSRWGLALLVLCSTLNVLALIKLLPRLNWW